jgi:macrolide-specific efflux system membrane fusion protein
MDEVRTTDCGQLFDADNGEVAPWSEQRARIDQIQTIEHGAKKTVAAKDPDIDDLSTMTVWSQVSEADVTRLREGMPVYFMTLGHDDRRWTGRLRQILPAPQKPDRPAGQTDAGSSASTSANNVVTYTALFDVQNPAGDLRPDMTAQVFFIVAAVKDALIVPTAALHKKDSTDPAMTMTTMTVTVVDDSGHESERTVRVGLRTRFRAEIVSGLSAGERVVTGRRAPKSTSNLLGIHL